MVYQAGHLGGQGGYEVSAGLSRGLRRYVDKTGWTDLALVSTGWSIRERPTLVVHSLEFFFAQLIFIDQAG